MHERHHVSNEDLHEQLLLTENAIGGLSTLIHDLQHHLESHINRVERNLEHKLDHLKEQIVTLQGSTDRLGTVVQKILTDAQTQQTANAALQAEIDRLVAQGSANATELANLQTQSTTAVEAIDTQVGLLEALDASVQDPSNPIDPEAPVEITP